MRPYAWELPRLVVTVVPDDAQGVRLEIPEANGSNLNTWFNLDTGEEMAFCRLWEGCRTFYYQYNSGIVWFGTPDGLSERLCVSGRFTCSDRKVKRQRLE